MAFGFLESIYEKCLLIELRKTGLHAESQEPITVYYENGLFPNLPTSKIIETQ